LQITLGILGFGVGVVVLLHGGVLQVPLQHVWLVAHSLLLQQFLGRVQVPLQHISPK